MALERHETASGGPVPVTPIHGLTRPFVRFLHVESASGVVLVACTALAILLANSPWGPAYAEWWSQQGRVGVGGAALDYPLWYWVNDGLMTVFFFVIGLEIKREVVAGELSDRRKMALPVVAAVGGALVPAMIFAALRHGQPGARGWAIPMATDIAFVVGCLSLLGARVPAGLKIFVLTLAIVDDILAVSIIAVFYTEEIKLAWLVAAAAGFGVTALLNRLGVRAVAIYVFVGAAIWLCTLKSGIHPTIAGVLLGLLTPASAWLGSDALAAMMAEADHTLRRGTRSDRSELLGRLKLVSREVISPLERLEVGLHPWVAFVIVPLFALANAAVPLHVDALADGTSIAVAAGLVLGKPIGILASSWIVIRLGWSALPRGVTWPIIAGASCLAGIGFTMSLFVASLGLAGEPLLAAKSGVLAGSVLSAGAGFAILWRTLPRRAAAPGAGGHDGAADPAEEPAAPA
jgi:NhaA family Na+:H+ antiporter